MAQPKSTVLPFHAEEGEGSFAWFKSQVDWSTEVKNDLLTGWRTNAQGYRDKLTPPRPDGIRVNIEFEKTEQKKHLLFYRLPDLRLRPHPRTLREAADPQSPERDLKRVVSIFREVLKFHIGPEGSNLKPTMDELIFDVLCPAGIAALKSGYERHVDGPPVLVPTGEMIPDPEFEQPGAVLNIAGVAAEPPMVPETAPAPNVVAEDYYDSRISPAELIIDMNFRGSDYAGKSRFLGYWFPITEAAAVKKGWAVPSKSAGRKSGDTPDDSKDRIIEMDKKGHREGQLRACEIFYYASMVDPSVTHPKKIRRLVFIQGAEKPAVHEDCKDQKWDERGRLIGGIDRLPIKVLTLRYISDFPYPPSDCAVTRKASDAIAEFRTSQIIHRRKAIPRVAVDVSKIADEKIKDKFLKGEHYDDIPVDGNPNNIAADIATPTYPNDNWRTNDVLMDDVNRAWALGANQSGSVEGGATATEIASINQATANRLDGERAKVVGEFFMDVVRHKAQLIQLYADQEDYVEIVGPNGAKTIEAWNKDTLAGKFLFEAVPDSSMPPDAQADRDRALNLYNLSANDPNINREQLTRDLIEAYGLDPDLLVKKAEPTPPKPPDPPKVSVSMTLQDLLNPATAAIAEALLASANVTISATSDVPQPEGAQPAADEPITPAPVIDKERLRMAEADNQDQRAGGLVGAV